MRTVQLFAVVLCISGLPSALCAQDRPVEDERQGLFPEPRLLQSAIELVERRAPESGETKDEGKAERESGFYPTFKSILTGDGWLTVGAGYRHPLFDERAFVDSSVALSWRGYRMAQADLEFPVPSVRRLTVGSQLRWQDIAQLSYFGIGPDSKKSNRSDYELRSLDLTGYGTYELRTWLTLEARLGWLAPPDVSSSGGFFDPDYPDAMTMFPAGSGFDLAEQPSFVHGAVAIVADTRDHASYPNRGGLYHAGWTRYADTGLDRFAFQRFDVEGIQFVPLSPRRWTLVLRGWILASTSAVDREIPVYMLPSLGGSNTIRAYSDFRFHDRNLLLATVESRLALTDHIDGALFVDAGSVAPRVGDLDLSRRGYGVGLRVHTRTATIGRIDVATGDDGWRVTFGISGPFRLSRLSDRTAAVPFAP